MNKDPITPQPSPGSPTLEQLADLVYKSSLAEGNKDLRRANPLVTVPVTIAMYGLAIGVSILLAKHTEAGKKALKTVGVSLEEEAAKEEPPPPPPPPPPPAPVAPAAPKVESKTEAPPPPPIDPRQEVVPDFAPKELPKQDLSMAYSGSSGSGTGVPGAGVAGAGGPSTGPAVIGAGMGHVVDFDFSQIKIKYQPPMPPYPPLARIARIQGNVTVEIIIGTDGIPTKATAVDGPPQLRPAAEAYALTWKFEPAMMNNVPQIGRFKLTLQYKLKN